ncbi:S-adenosyl-L-methionine-dependent methyltransferase [Flagelloscypha sp. PMI_526]|nr:S-adenosyl-L-methionine-dependent methyltransferase [Flagelloscypha sp. PMI_526]
MSSSSSASPRAASSRAQAKLQQLLSLIQSSANDAIDLYAKAEAGVPSPDLLRPHPMDSVSDAVQLKKTLRVLEGACELLCTTLSQPMHTLANRASSSESNCLRIAVRYKIADKLVAYPEGCHISDLAADTGLDERKLGHVMRLLATRNCFREVYQDTFTNNRISVALLSTNHANIAQTLSIFTEEARQGTSALVDVISDSEWGPSNKPSRSAFIYRTQDEMRAAGFEVGERGTFIDWQALHPDIRTRFGQGMIGWSNLTASGAVVTHYPWNDYSEGTKFCDVGSGPGHVSLALAKAHPHLRITLQDLPGPIEQARAFWSAKHPLAIENGHVQFQSFDFFKESPVPNQDVYYLKHIIHIFPDDLALTVLQRIVDVMPADGKLLIQETVTQSAAEDAFKNDFGLDMAPLPSSSKLWICMYNAQERNIAEFSSLGKRAGLRLLKAWDYCDSVVLEFIKDETAPDSAVDPHQVGEDSVKQWVLGSREPRGDEQDYASYWNLHYDSDFGSEDEEDD